MTPLKIMKTLKQFKPGTTICVKHKGIGHGEQHLFFGYVSSIEGIGVDDVEFLCHGYWKSFKDCQVQKLTVYDNDQKSGVFSSNELFLTEDFE